jgi:hypothetical protein
MELTLVYSPTFVREWNRHRFTDADLQALQDEIRRSPDGPPVIRGAGGLRKMRFSPPSRHTGKRGSMRVGFAYLRLKAAVLVVTIYGKNEASDLSPEQKREIAKWLKLMERDFR